MSWVDTSMVKDAKQDLEAFRQLLSRLPGPLGSTTSVETCAEAFARGIERRSARVNVPGWVEVLRWLKPVLTSRLAELQGRREVRQLLPLMDDEVTRLGRSTSSRTTAQSAEHEDPREVTERL
jgi:hypothetical protein